MEHSPVHNGLKSCSFYRIFIKRNINGIHRNFCINVFPYVFLKTVCTCAAKFNHFAHGIYIKSSVQKVFRRKKFMAATFCQNESFRKNFA